VLNDIRGIDWPGNDLFGETTCNIGIVSGGTRANVIPDAAQATIQIRLADSSLAIKEHLEYAIAGRATIDYKSIHDPIRLLRSTVSKRWSRALPRTFRISQTGGERC
jgi:acetylornithine deacetylase